MVGFDAILSRYTPKNFSKNFNVSRVTSCTLRLSNGGLTIKTLSFLEYHSCALSLSFKFFFFCSFSIFWSCSTIVLRSLDISVCNSYICDVCVLFLLTIPLVTSSVLVDSIVQSINNREKEKFNSVVLIRKDSVSKS